MRKLSSILLILALLDAPEAFAHGGGGGGATPMPKYPLGTYTGTTKFDFHVHYAANFFTVVDNMSLWSSFCRHSYRESWEHAYGLSGADLKLLDAYKEVRKHWGYGQMEPIFLPADTLSQAWANAAVAGVSKEDLNTLKAVFSHFEPKFRKEWAKAKFLYQREKELETDLAGRRAAIDKFFRKVAAFYHCPHPPAVIDVYLLMSYDPGGGGGEANGPATLQVGTNPINPWTIVTLIHESAHLMEEYQSELFNSVLAAAHQAGDAGTVLHEAPVYALAQGLFAQNVMKVGNSIEESIKVKTSWTRQKMDYYMTTSTLAARIMPLTAQYLQKGRPIDHSYYDQLIRLYQNIQAASGAAATPQTEKATAEVNAVISAMEKAYTAGNAAAWLSHFLPSAQVADMDSGTTSTLTQYGAALRTTLTGTKLPFFAISGREIYLQKRTATVLADWFTSRTKGFKSGRMEFVLVRQNGAWKVFSLLYSR